MLNHSRNWHFKRKQAECGRVWVSYFRSCFFMWVYSLHFKFMLPLCCVFPALMNLLWLWYAVWHTSVIELLLLDIPEELLKRQEDT